ncbi:MAG: MBG domain-containing protein, partial [Burkholderiales bacterium]|nr:MBG domain-containing protein [Burkholderiales bacterium]
TDTVITTGSGAVAFAGTVDGGHALTVNSSGAKTFGGAVGATTALSSLGVSAGSTTAINGGSITTTGAQSFGNAVTLGGLPAATLTAGGDVSFSSTVNGARALTINTPGNTVFGAAVGNTTALTGITTNDGGVTSLAGNVSTTNAPINFGDQVVLAGNSTVSAGSGAVTFSATVNSSGAARALTVNSTGVTTFGGAVGGGLALASLTTNAGGSTVIGGGAVTTTGNQNWGDAVTLTADTVLTGATPTFTSTVNGGGLNLRLDYSGLTILNGANFTGIRNLETGNGGATQLSGAIVTTGSQTYHDSVTTTGAVTLNAGGAISASAPVTATAGPLTLISSASIDLSTTGSDFGTVQATAAGNLTLTDINNIIISSVAAGGSVRIAASGNLTLNGAVSAAAAGDAAVLAAGGNFNNAAGAAAVSTPSGRWLVYSADPDTAVFGGLISGNAGLWSQTFSGNPPETVAVGGNRYLFAAGRVLTISAGDGSKVYGDDVTGQLTAYAVNGLNTNTYGGVITADTQIVAVAGLPGLTSAGTAANAGVAGSPYAITAGAGTLSSPHGYTFAYSGVPGQLTVSPAPLTVTASDAARNFGDPNPAFSAAYAGLRAGDTPAALGGMLLLSTPADQSSQPGYYAINAAGLSSPNYTLTYVPGQLQVIGRTTVTVNPQMNVQDQLLSIGAVIEPRQRTGEDSTLSCRYLGPIGGFACAGK